MAKIRLSQQEELEVSKETALRIKEQWQDPDVKNIEIGGKIFKKSRIIEVDSGNSNLRDKPYNLKDEEDHRLIKDFEQEMEDVKAEKLEHELEYYGRPIKIVDAVGKMPAKKLPPNYVGNELLGIIHAGIIQYCLRNKIMHKKFERFYWIAPECTAFLEKRKALRELQDKREYAEKLNQEAMSQIEESKKAVAKKI